jgi:hypothetical protein
MQLEFYWAKAYVEAVKVLMMLSQQIQIMVLLSWISRNILLLGG